MNNITITVLSDDFEKSKSFARYLGGGVCKKIDETRELFILECEGAIIRAMHPNQGQRGHRHNKIYVDTDSPKAVEMALEMFQYKTLPLFFANFKIEVEIKRPMEFVNFDKEIAKYKQIKEALKQ